MPRGAQNVILVCTLPSTQIGFIIMNSILWKSSLIFNQNVHGFDLSKLKVTGKREMKAKENEEMFHGSYHYAREFTLSLSVNFHVFKTRPVKRIEFICSGVYSYTNSITQSTTKQTAIK